MVPLKKANSSDSNKKCYQNISLIYQSAILERRVEMILAFYAYEISNDIFLIPGQNWLTMIFRRLRIF